jgi:hypothetical protein
MLRCAGEREVGPLQERSGGCTHSLHIPFHLLSYLILLDHLLIVACSLLLCVKISFYSVVQVMSNIYYAFHIVLNVQDFVNHENPVNKRPFQMWKYRLELDQRYASMTIRTTSALIISVNMLLT